MTRSTSLLLLALSLFASGCLSTRVAYDNADWVLMREVRKMTCPDDARAEALEREIQGLHYWHRRVELPRYVSFLKRFAALVEQPAERTRFDALFAELGRGWDRLRRRMVKSATAHVQAFGPRELTCMREALAERWKEGMEKIEEADEDYGDDRLEERLDWIERWAGDLNDAQKALLAAVHPPELERDRALHLARRDAGERFLTALEAADRAGRAEMLQRLGQDSLAFYTPEGRVLAEAARARTHDLAWETSRVLDVEQRVALRDKLLEFARELAAIARPSG